MDRLKTTFTLTVPAVFLETSVISQAFLQQPVVKSLRSVYLKQDHVAGERKAYTREYSVPSASWTCSRVRGAALQTYIQSLKD